MSFCRSQFVKVVKAASIFGTVQKPQSDPAPDPTRRAGAPNATSATVLHRSDKLASRPSNSFVLSQACPLFRSEGWRERVSASRSSLIPT